MKNARVRPPCPRQSWRKAPGCLPCVILEENGHPASEVRFLGSISSLSRRGDSDAWLVRLKGLAWTVALHQERAKEIRLE
ncbi:hypothetical protein K443DRAFT_109229 [Laccaria amethystina LaAM-08-1]|uniref:Uncharacterized protein n=1 Tax=Laccaria amethystina LaAM-08-1 TaxID=1095629 RepID=A0A0C9X1K2_9AGAR|nr:hypothetical protein K443DRAFT_109229 [Laccaria amethystina LaAM-08-1]